MATLSSAGIGSGLDVNSIVKQIVSLERRPIEQLQTQAGKLNTQLSAVGKIQGALATLRDAALALTRPGTWSATVASSSDSAAVAVSATDGASAGRYAVEVQQLAKPQVAAGPRLASSAEPVGAGTLTIRAGTWSADGSALATGRNADGSERSFDIEVPEGTTLAGLRDLINARQAGVSASILNDGSGARLVLRSSDTGEANGFAVSAAPGASATLGALAFSDLKALPAGQQVQRPADALLTIDGLAVRSASNTVSGAIDGVSFTLSKTTSAPVTASVTQDDEGMKKSIEAFVEAYNAAAKLLGSQTKYDEGSKTAGPLQGDSTTVAIQRQLRSLVGAGTSASASFARLSDIGLELQADGTLQVKAGKLDAALAKLPELQKFLAATDAANPAAEGVARRLLRWGDALLGSEGAVSTRTSGLQGALDANKKRQGQLEDRIALTEKRLLAQYGALDTKMSRLNALSSYVSQQVSQWSRNGNGG